MSLSYKEIPSKVFVNNFYDSTINENRRYCFILGSGASRESGIRTGQELAKIWKTEIDQRYTTKEINDIKKHLGTTSNLSPEESRNYFDIYGVRFHPDYINGYTFLEKELSNKEPSFGYYHLAKILSETKNNLVLTTNFDSLSEDAIFIYTDISPLVISHESLAGYIHANMQRPIIAKIHRGIFFDPLNRRDETNTLSKAWYNTLDMVFSIFTPVVIGYAGGDKSLMRYLEETDKLKSIYWCYRGEKPDDDIQKIVEKANGYFIEIDGFDAIMFQIGVKFKYGDPIQKLKDITQKRITQYEDKYEKFTETYNKEGASADIKDTIIENTNNIITISTQAIRLDLNDSTAYNNRGVAYSKLERYGEAINDYTEAIRINPNYSTAYNNRGVAYSKLERYGEAINDYTIAIRINSKYSLAYYNRGYAYDESGKIKEAINDYTEAIRLDPNSAVAYNNRGYAYCYLKKCEEAINDYFDAIHINPNYSTAYNNIYATIQQVLRTDSNNPIMWRYLSIYWKKSGNMTKAKECYQKAIEYGLSGEMEAKIKIEDKDIEQDS